jgi:hypothetical protein
MNSRRAVPPPLSITAEPAGRAEKTADDAAD